ncbi:CPBP family intramembrane glutamic endopeptidase [uncultured Dokdonia sp.]|uniref:CPBP family intramembrane glutamic endopeptidase n=1 Tax=uncultured Dokdonia sp. TaxID=575653 RepID=UPI00260CF3A3|nr:CPBP family intramembrane glutamic endopeptidase [uncultured Dokdonia sp.]
MTSSEKTRFLFLSFFKMWGLYILFYITVFILSIWIPELKSDTYEDNNLNELLQNNSFKLFVLACIFAPIIEEMMFRTLVKPTHSDIILFICSWPVFIGFHFLSTKIHWGITLAFSAVLLFTLFYILKHLITENHTQRLRNFLHKHLTIILILVSIIFGLVHINNYVDTFIIDLALIVLIIPRIISGFLMGWVKIKNQGLIWSIGLHFMNNIFIIGIGILISKKAETLSLVYVSL